MRGFIITVDGLVERFEGGYPELYEAVGGYIEPAPCKRRDVTIFCNEDGKRLELAPNALANFVWVRLGDMGCQAGGDYLVGNVVVTGGVGPDGETMNVSDDIESLISFIATQLKARR